LKQLLEEISLNSLEEQLEVELSFFELPLKDYKDNITLHFGYLENKVNIGNNNQKAQHTNIVHCSRLLMAFGFTTGKSFLIIDKTLDRCSSLFVELNRISSHFITLHCTSSHFIAPDRTSSHQLALHRI
jgi:hypothetical protein